MDRRQILSLIGAGAGLAGLPGGAFAQGAPEKAKVTLGVGGKSLLYYLPLTIAERRGFFKDYGLDMEINDFAGGARSLQALVGGSVDLVAGAYEHTLRMQAKGQDIRATIEMLRFPTIVIAVRKAIADKVKSPADFKGLKIGVTAPGSSTYITVVHAMSKAGLRASDASFIGVGGGASAVAAMKRGEIDLISHLDPVIAKLETDGDVVIPAPRQARAPCSARPIRPPASICARTSSRRTRTPRRRPSTASTRRFAGSTRPRPPRSPMRCRSSTTSATRRSTSRRCSPRRRPIPRPASWPRTA
jgi:ABC-type nitrate/sulfonate/bicarbonate transport system substrate-binding protein